MLSVFGLVAPLRLTRMVRGAVEQAWGIYLAVGARLLLGGALIVAAATSRFPVLFEILGWVALAAAVGLALLGRGRLRALMGWIEGLPVPVLRVWLVFGALFGGLLAYGIPLE